MLRVEQQGEMVDSAAETTQRSISPLLVVCCAAFLLFLIAATIILALIPVYLTVRTIDRVNVRPAGFTLAMALRNGVLPTGAITAENCATIQNKLHLQAVDSGIVRRSIPSVASCTVVGNTTAASKRKRREIIRGNQLDLVVNLPAGTCFSNQCSLRRANAFIAFLIALKEFTLNLAIADGSRFDFQCAYTSSSAASLEPIVSTNPDVTLYAIDTANQLFRLSTRNPKVILSSVRLTGVKSGDTVSNIDFRPATGQLYGVSGTQLYIINEDTGLTRPIGSAINASTFGRISSMEFNPALDVLRVITDKDTNLRLNPETGAVLAVDPSIAGDKGLSSAFNSNLAGAVSTTLYLLNTTSNTLLQQNPPTDLALIPVGSGVGFTIEESCGFDISFDGLVIACARIAGIYSLYLVDLTLGVFSQNLGPTLSTISSFAIPTAPIAYAITAAGNSLLFVHTINSQQVLTAKAISGLAAGETLPFIDMRPANGQLYAVSSANRLYTLHLGSSVATPIGTAPLLSVVSGVKLAIDFNPTVDRLRLVTTARQNLRINPVNGAVITDGSLNPGSPKIEAIAYTNNFANATTTVLYDIDGDSRRLLIQNPPNNGTLVDVAPVGIAFSKIYGFDIGGKTGRAVVVLEVNGAVNIYQINLSTGAATLIPNSTFTQPITAFCLGLNQ